MNDHVNGNLTEYLQIHREEAKNVQGNESFKVRLDCGIQNK